MDRQDLGAGPSCPRARVAMQTFVRIIGSRLDRYVEFEFTVDDPDLTVELILPFGAFEEFCKMQGAEILPPAPDVAQELERQAWRAHRPGLLRPVAGNTSN